MDFKFKITLDGKTHKDSVHFPTPAAVSLTIRNVLYRHYKTADIDMPYIGEMQVRDFIDLGYLDLSGTKINGKTIADIKAEIQ